MRKAILLAAVSALLVGSLVSCEQSTGTAPDAAAGSARREPAPAEKALAAVSTAHAHQAVEHAGERVVYHPGWSGRIAVVDAAGERTEIYRQTRAYHGSPPGEVALGFRDMALAVFDPNHRIRGITVHTLDSQDWSFVSLIDLCPPVCPPDGTVPPPAPSRAPAEHGQPSVGAACPPYCPEGTGPPPTPSLGLLCPPYCPEGTDPPPTPSLAPAAAPLDPARLALPPAERARASVSTGPEHRAALAVGERVTYHPGWSSRIGRVDAAGRSLEVYRQIQPYRGRHPREVALGFRDVALALFDPNHRVAGITVETLDGQVWLFADNGQLCPPNCPLEENP
jgi:hypothetical protein